MKKVIGLLLTLFAVFVLTASTFAMKIDETNAPEGFGDVNGDSITNNKDVTELFRFVSDDCDFDPSYDVNGDGAVNNKDITTLFRFVSGMEVEVSDDLAGHENGATLFTVSRAFDDGMVIQRNEYIRVWGFADDSENGKYVYAEFSGLKGQAIIENGHWIMTLNGTLTENTAGQTLRVYGSKDTEYTFNDVLVGDVYWAVGQSNIDLSVSKVASVPVSNIKAKTCPKTDDYLIRLNRSYYLTDDAGLLRGTRDVNEDAVQPRGWEYPSQGAGEFSAIGYFTAVQLYEALDKKVPIGMIEFDGNGCALHAFLSNEVADALKIDTWNGSQYTAAGVNAHPSRFMYNHYMYSFQNMPICGIIWYQGESDCQADNNNRSEYPERFTYYINWLREQHNQINKNYPVYLIEFPSMYVGFDYAAVRMNMERIPYMLENAHIVVSSDVWNDLSYSDGLHPYIKWEQSERLTALILANAYGIGDMDKVCGPLAASAELSEDGLTVTVKFDHVGDGLTAMGKSVKGFKIKTGAKWIKPQSTEIVGTDTVVITAGAPIKAVGYETELTDFFPTSLTLCNSEGVPAAAFQLIFE